MRNRALVAIAAAVVIGIASAPAAFAVSSAAVPSARPAAAAGRSVVITVSGLPSATTARITLTRKGGPTRSVTAGNGSTTVGSLRPGTYAVTARPLTVGGSAVSAAVTPRLVQVTASKGAAVSVSYAQSGPATSTWSWEAKRADGTVLEKQSGTMTISTRTLTNGATVTVTFSSSMFFPSDPLDDPCADVPNGAVDQVGVVLNGGKLSEAVSDQVGSLKLPSKTTFACGAVDGRRVDTITYTGTAIYYSGPGAKSATGAAAVFPNFAIGDSTGSAGAVVQASGQQVTANG